MTSSSARNCLLCANRSFLKRDLKCCLVSGMNGNQNGADVRTRPEGTRMHIRLSVSANPKE